MDHHVPAAITDGLRKRNIDILTADEDGRANLDDASLLARATQLNRVFFSQDRDLLIIASRWQQNGIQFSGLIYAHQMQTSIGTAVKDLELIAKTLDQSDMENIVLRIPL